MLAKSWTKNGKLAQPKDTGAVAREALVRSALESAQRRGAGLSAHKSSCPARSAVCRICIAGISRSGGALVTIRCIWPDRSGHGSKGIVASSAALAVLVAGRHR